MFLFADDTKVYRGIIEGTDCDKLQMDIYIMNAWSEEWLLKFHPDKFQNNENWKKQS